MRRETPQRRALRKALLAAGRPLTPEEVLAAGRELVPSLGIATVYRNLKLLVREGWLREVVLPGEPARYETADGPHHHHFLCRSCDQAFDVEACPPRVEEMAAEGFEVESHEVILYGRCPACA